MTVDLKRAAHEGLPFFEGAASFRAPRRSERVKVDRRRFPHSALLKEVGHEQRHGYVLLATCLCRVPHPLHEETHDRAGNPVAAALRVVATDGHAEQPPELSLVPELLLAKAGAEAVRLLDTTQLEEDRRPQDGCVLGLEWNG